ncbi:MAG: endonuclease III [Spirochaetaceae bacterium]|nr:MAG: endonuclease III [Spirochaetaceae bacterium]
MTSTTKTSKTDPTEILGAIRTFLSGTALPSVSQVALRSPDPFRILISTMISLRTRDEVTLAATDRLFALAQTPHTMAGLTQQQVAAAIYPAGFYRTKAHSILAVSQILQQQYDGSVPDTLEQLTALPGVGRKTANLVLGLGFAIPSICVDTHVHRITNRLGWITTRTPDQSEIELQHVLPTQWWIAVNELLVRFGQQICTPQSPWCSRCPVAQKCPRAGVTRER